MRLERLLVLVRHGQSEFNLQNLFTGWLDPGLTSRGVEEAYVAGRHLQRLGITFDVAFSSGLIRASQSCRIILDELGQHGLAVVGDKALNERDYGELSGLDKDEARRRWGDEQVRLWRRSYAIPPPGGESLKDTVARVLPYYVGRILPCVMQGNRVLVTAHGNSLRALVMVLDRLTAEDIAQLELATGDLLVYRLKDDTTVEDKQVFPAGS